MVLTSTETIRLIRDGVKGFVLYKNNTLCYRVKGFVLYRNNPLCNRVKGA